MTLGQSPTEEDAFRLRCIGLLLLADVMGYKWRHMVHEAARQVGEDPLYLELKRGGTPSVGGVQQRLMQEAKRLCMIKPVEKPRDDWSKNLCE